ncbi:hypothetical protein [Streptomyces sp. NBC_00568]|uniref:hypothetical protein n=1 Tax=Streptomyces sp. NBC_00568 TaxID=2975779 RepID=UPI0022519817|nr:hypothetical protein [Streptomyces sp. NBC_00568]MCX4993430.1 hypothetical protein [Streptomyces sp. NBC_00568]
MSHDPTPPMPNFPPAEPSAKKNHTQALIIGGAVLAIAAIVTAGVVVSNSRDSDGKSGSAAASESEAGTGSDNAIKAEEEPEPTPTSTEPEIYKLVDSVTYENGVELSLASYKRGVSSDIAAPGNTEYIAFTMTIVNRGDTVVDLGTSFFLCHYGDESKEGEQIFDEGLDDGPLTALRPGRTAKTKVACAFPKNATYLQIETAPSVDMELSIFAGDVK